MVTLRTLNLDWIHTIEISTAACPVVPLVRTVKSTITGPTHIKAIESLRSRALEDAKRAEIQLQKFLYDNMEDADLATYKSNIDETEDKEHTRVIHPANGIGGVGFM